MAETAQEKKDKGEAGVATDAQNAKLKHTAEIVGDEKGAVTTRDDALDVGVPMLQGSPREPQGPEDAAGDGPKRGDYSERTGGIQHHETRRVDDPLEDPWIRDEDGNPVDRKPHTQLVAQTPNFSDQGEVEGKKGGVETADAASA